MVAVESWHYAALLITASSVAVTLMLSAFVPEMGKSVWKVGAIFGKKKKIKTDLAIICSLLVLYGVVNT